MADIPQTPSLGNNPPLPTASPVVDLDVLMPKNTSLSSSSTSVPGALNLSNLSIKAEAPKDDTESKKKTNELLSAVDDPKAVSSSSTQPGNKIQFLVSLYVLTFFSILLIVVIQFYSKYLRLENQLKIEENDLSFVQKIENIEVLVSKTLNINDYAIEKDKTNLLMEDATKDLAVETIKNNPRLDFSQKKKILQKNLDNLSNDILSNQTKLTDLKMEIEKYGFIPKELFDMTQKKDTVTNIRRAMLLRENMKFITAFKIFGYLDSFIQTFSSYNDVDPAEVRTQMNAINEFGEKDIIAYTNTCYFNPYEIGSDCSVTRDFDNYYSIMNTKSSINPEFLKKMADYIDRKLEETELPTYTINFPEFDSQKNTINFTTDLNTNKQDELALSKLGIQNPHLYIITNMINTLKQSLLIIGENIKTNQIKIAPKIIRIGTTIFTVNNSTLTFSLPIQKNKEREITDFFSIQKK